MRPCGRQDGGPEATGGARTDIMHAMRKLGGTLPGLALAAALLVPAGAGAHTGEAPVTPEAVAERMLRYTRPPLPMTPRVAEEPPIVATPKADCRPGSKPELGLQGRLAKADVDAGRADEGFWCNLTRVGHIGATGGFRVHRYIDQAGRECAYYDTALLFPTNLLSLSGESAGVAVLDMTDPTRPVRTTTLTSPAMLTPHESLNLSVERGILAAVMGNPAQYPGFIDVYDLREDCRYPRLRSALFPGTPWGHESGMAPDGRTFYPSSPASTISAVDLTDPAAPRTLVTSELTSHGLSVSDDGRRGYFAVGNGLIITDLSEVQDRKPNPQIREISRLTWSNVSIPQVAIPVTIKGRAYVVEIDEYSATNDGTVASHGPRVGAARIIDVADERHPRVVSNIRLEVHQPEHRGGIAGDPGARSPLQGYAGHYCNVPQRVEPGIVACSMINSGLRVFDIRDPERPKEIAYHVAPPSTISITGAPIIDERSNWAMSQPAFAPERGEIWYSDGNSGFYTLRMDPAVWPFPQETGAGGCVATRGIRSASVAAAGRGLRFGLSRLQRHPVRVDVLRVSDGRRVLGERRVASFARRSGSFRWARGRLAPGVYVARFVMKDGSRTVDTRHVVFERTRTGRVRTRPSHRRAETCGLLRSAKIDRPVFGGPGRAPLRLSYRTTKDAEVTVTVLRGGKVVRTVRAARATAGRTVRVALPASAIGRGDVRVRVRAVSGDDQAVVTLGARRL